MSPSYTVWVTYIRRAVDYSIPSKLASTGAILLEGARGCGKTETGTQHTRSQFRVDRAQNRRLAQLHPSAALDGETPRLIDEWQLAPDLWNGISHEIDTRRQPSQFLLAGSAKPATDTTQYVEAGQISRIKMRPMTLGEAYPQEDFITLSQLRELKTLPPVTAHLAYKELAIEAVRGGWPALIATKQNGFVRYVRNYLESIAQNDLARLGTAFSPGRVLRLLRSLSRHLSSEATATTLSADIAANGGELSAASVRTYLDALTRIFILEELPAWSGSLRSKARLRKQSKLHFCDPSLACAALRVTPKSLAQDPEYFGQVFKSMVVRDIRTYAEQINASCFGYRDEYGLEVDLLLEFAEGGWAGIEVKLGESYATIAAAEKNLLRLRDARMVTAPDFLAVITGGTNAFTLPSGIHVLPLCTLGPLG